MKRIEMEYTILIFNSKGRKSKSSISQVPIIKRRVYWLSQYCKGDSTPFNDLIYVLTRMKSRESQWQIGGPTRYLRPNDQSRNTWSIPEFPNWKFPKEGVPSQASAKPKTLRIPQIEDTLTVIGITPYDIQLPLTPNEEGRPSLIHHFLPLENYDSTISETDLGIAEKVKGPLPGIAYLPSANQKESVKLDSYRWNIVRTVSYDEATKKWMVSKINGEEKFYLVSRIYIFFLLENIEEFAYRLKSAVEFRKIEEARIRVNVYIQEMPPRRIQTNSALTEGIFQKCGFSKLDVSKKSLVQAEIARLDEAINTELIFRTLIFSSPELKRFADFNDLHESTINHTLATSNKAKLMDAVVDLCFQKVRCARVSVLKQFLYVQSESISAINAVRNECRNLEDLNFFSFENQQHTALSEFYTLQRSSIAQTFTFLRNDWIAGIVSKVQSCLRSVKKGWFDMKVSDPFIYDLSKLSKLINLATIFMETALRDLVRRSITYFRDTITLQDNKSFRALFAFRILPGRDAEEIYKYLDEYKKVCLSMIHDILIISHDVSTIHTVLLPNLRFSKSLRLSSVGLLDAVVVDVCETISLAFDDCAKALHELEEYCQELLSPIERAAPFEDCTFEELKTKIEACDSIATAIREIQESCTIVQPFEVSFDDVKEYVHTTHYSWLGSLLSKINDGLIQISNKCDGIEAGAVTEVCDIEEAVEKFKWFEDIPSMILDVESDIAELDKGFQILEDLKVNVDDEQFQKWIKLRMFSVIFDQRVPKLLGALREKEEVYKEQYLSDVSKFLEDSNSLALTVEYFRKELSENQITNADNEIEKLLETLEMSLIAEQLLQRRSELFGMQPIASITFNLIETLKSVVEKNVESFEKSRSSEHFSES